MTEPTKNPGEFPTYHGICPYCASAVSCITRDGVTYARCSHRGCGARGPYHRDLVRAVELFTRMDHPTRAHAAGADAPHAGRAFLAAVNRISEATRTRITERSAELYEESVEDAGVDAPRVDTKRREKTCNICGASERHWVTDDVDAVCEECGGGGRIRIPSGPSLCGLKTIDCEACNGTGRTEAPRVDAVCEECADGAYPYYGGAPGRDYAGPSEKDFTYTGHDGRMHIIPAGAFIFAQRAPSPRETWPANFTEDPECPGLGTWSCPKCSTGRTEAAKEER